MRRWRSTLKIFILALIGTLWAAPAAAHDALSEIERANRLVEDKHYEDAIHIYESVLQEGFENGYLYYNLGNAYFRKGDTGRAILNYLKARRLVPREEKVEANLLFAIQKTEDRLDWRIPDWVTTVLFWVQDITLREHVWALLIGNVIFWPVAALSVTRRSPGTRLARGIVLGLLGLVLVSTAARGWYDAQHRYAVVLAETLPVYAQRDEKQPVLFRLHEGAVAVIREEDNGWYHILLADESTGWVRSQDSQVGT